MGKKIADYWEASGKILTDPTVFLDSLLNFDKDNISEAVIEKIEPFIAMEAFTPAQVSKFVCVIFIMILKFFIL